MNRFNSGIYTKEIGDYIPLLFEFASELISGDKDNLVATTYERKVLPEFKKRSKFAVKQGKFEFIGLEDYFFLHELFCRDKGITNPEKFYFSDFMKRMFLDSIYDSGNLNQVHSKFPKNFVRWLNAFDNIFTTNYDSNLELSSGKDVFHLHGSFDKLADVYDENSLRNKLKLDEYDFIEGYDYLYCNAIFDFSGFGKDFKGKMSNRANSAIEKFADVYKKDELSEHKEEIDGWKDSDNDLVKRLYGAIHNKVQNPNDEFEDSYHFNRFSCITGELVFLGLSPNNDNHIIEMVRSNKDIKNIVYYYFSKEESEIIENCFPNIEVKKLSVNEFWKTF